MNEATLYDYYFSGTAGPSAVDHVFPAPMTAVLVKNDGSATIYVTFKNSKSGKSREVWPGEGFSWSSAYGIEGCSVYCDTSSAYRLDGLR